jgi:hypothetical protein
MIVDQIGQLHPNRGALPALEDERLGASRWADIPKLLELVKRPR